MTLSSLYIEDIVRAALKEDLGHGHDITSQSLIDPHKMAAAKIVARAPGIVAGIVPAMTAFIQCDPDFEIAVHKNDGEILERGEIIAEIDGPARELLMAERTALNFLTMMSGVASLTAQYVMRVEDTKAQIADTRKTLPGLRALQKFAVRCGGGMNHRFGLDDAILIKDNHIAAAGGIEAALDKATFNAGHMVKIEIEVDTLAQLNEVLAHGGADIVMLDNFTLDDMKVAVEKVAGKLVTEASGGVTLETVRGIAETGVDIISVGALTHSAPALDIALDF